MDIDEKIKYWVCQANAEYDLSDKNGVTAAYFKRLKGIARFEFKSSYCLVYLISPDMWGEKQMSVLALYIKSDKRVRCLLKVFKRIEYLGRKAGCKTLLMGSHLNPRFNEMLSRIGYTANCFKKEL